MYGYFISKIAINKVIDFFFQDKPLGDQELVKDVVGRMVEESNLIGDGSQTCSLPTIPGKHQDLKSITNQTVRNWKKNIIIYEQLKHSNIKQILTIWIV